MQGELPDIGTLMGAARRRVLHVWLIVAAVLALISSGVPGAATQGNAPAIVLWFVGCLAILGVGGSWVRARHRATRRLTELLGAGTLDIERIEQNRLLLAGIPFGYEVDLYLRSGARLPFGFWTEDGCRGLMLALDGDLDAEGG